MTQIMSIFAASPGEGKRTISQNIAKILAQHNYKVLYVELDCKRPSFAKTTGLEIAEKNTLHYLEKIKETRKLNFQEFITNTKELSRYDKKMLKIFPSNMDFIVMPFTINKIPKLVENDQVLQYSTRDFMNTFVNNFRDTDYQIVIFSLPNDIQDLFSLPLMLQSDVILNIVTTNPTSLIENQEIFNSLKKVHDMDLNKWKTVINKFVDSIPLQNVENLLSNQNIIGTISNDFEKITNDLTQTIGTEKIDQELTIILNNLDFKIDMPKQSRFSFIKGN